MCFYSIYFTEYPAVRAVKKTAIGYNCPYRSISLIRVNGKQTLRFRMTGNFSTRVGDNKKQMRIQATTLW